MLLLLLLLLQLVHDLVLDWLEGAGLFDLGLLGGLQSLEGCWEFAMERRR
jgi:hypothetical protein